MTRKKKRNNRLDMKILSSLRSEASVKIFLECEKGIDSSTKAVKELGLTQKQYYTWLRRLVEAGLVEKRGNTYVQTTLGKYCYMLWKSFSKILNQRDQLELADKLVKSDTLSNNEKTQFLRAISKKDLLGTASLADVMHNVKMIVDYDAMIDEAVKLLGQAKESVYMAANKFDARVMEASFKVIDKGLSFFFLSSAEETFSESIQALKILLLDSEVEKVVRRLLTSGDLTVRSTKERLSHSFLVIDGKYGMIELPHPVSDDFYVAFKFRNALFCRNLIETFNSLYEKGKEDSRITFAKRFLMRSDRSKARQHTLPRAR